MSDIEIFIFVLLAALFLFDLYVLYKIYDFGWDIYRIKKRLDAIDYIQNEIIKTIKMIRKVKIVLMNISKKRLINFRGKR